MATRGRARRVLRALGVVAAVLAVAVAALLILPLPAPVLSVLAGKSSSWMLDPGPDQGFVVARGGRKLAGLAVQQGLADAFLEAPPLPKDLPDAERIGRRLAALKPLLISQTELPHAPVTPPAALAGIGWCDAVNGVGATVLAREFPQVEIVGVHAPEGVGGHSFGRLWSERGSEWLYFDLWTQEVSVFRSRRGHAAEYLFRARPVGGPRPRTEDSALIARIHDRAWSGFVHNRLQSTLGGYLFARLSNLVRHGDRSPAGAFEAIQAVVSSGPAPDFGPPAVPTAAPEAFVRARLAHFRGDPAEARRRYMEVLGAERGARSTFGIAARIFVERIDASRIGARRDAGARLPT